MASQADVRAVDNALMDAIYSEPDFVYDPFTGLPISDPSHSLTASEYESSPVAATAGVATEVKNTAVAAATKVADVAKSAGSMLSGILKGGLISVVLIAVVLVAVYAAVGAFVRR